MHIRIPLRISFIGGGTDIPPYPDRFGGQAISCTINRFVTVSTATSVPDIDTYSDIINKVFPFNHQNTLDNKIKVVSDMPPGTGLGTSSSIAVGLITAKHQKENGESHLNPYDAAIKAIELERDELQIVGGLQDQVIAAFPGLNKIYFRKERNIEVKPLIHFFPFHQLSEKLILVDTSVIRRQEKIMEDQIEKTDSGENDTSLHAIKDAVDHFEYSLTKQDWMEAAHVINLSWEWKKKLNFGVSIPEVDLIIEAAHKISKNIGTKLLGAGGGGYVLLFNGDPNIDRDYIDFTLTAQGFRCIKPKIISPLDLYYANE